MSDTIQPSYPIDQVAAAAGVDRTTLYQAGDAVALGSPAHFVYRSHCVVYTILGLCQLADGLLRIGRETEAKALAEFTRRERQLAASQAGVTTPDGARALARRWDIASENRHEQIYGGKAA